MFDIPLLSFPLYKLMSYTLTPFIPFYLKKRIKKGKEDPMRLIERYGKSNISRPTGRLIWLHAASVGELISSFSLINRLEKNHPDISILVTTGTVTSARMAQKHLPSTITHQFAPLDSPLYVSRFLNHWKPDLVLWLESEFWPNQLLSLRSRKIPTLLLNARISDASFQKWSKHPRSIKSLLNCFSGLSAQSPEDRDKLHILAAGREVFLPGNLKQAAAPLPYDKEELDSLIKSIGKRKVIVVASTHKGEEETLLHCYRKILVKLNPTTPQPIMVLVPRHPDRGDYVEETIKGTNLIYSRRSKNNIPTSETQIYLADTLGELGLFYALSDIAFIGGSVSGNVGGHNPVEAALLNCAIVYGPDMANFKAITKSLETDDAAIACSTEEDIISSFITLLENSKQQKLLSANASNWASDQSEAILKRVEVLLLKYLPNNVSGGEDD